MKLFFEDYDPEFELQSKVDSEVYDALADIAFGLNKRGISGSELKKYFDHALEWFDLHFWDGEELNEAKIKGKEVDLTKKVHTIAYALTEPKNKQKFNKILDDFDNTNISLEEAKKLMIQLFSEFDNVPKDEIRKAQSNISNITRPSGFAIAMGTYLTGNKVLKI